MLRPVLAVLASALAVGGAQASAPPTLAQVAATKLGLSCAKVTTSDGVSYLKCSGKIPSFDGLGLDTDVSIPLGATTARTDARHAARLGQRQDRSGKPTRRRATAPARWHWNNVWFVSKGWVVVNYTARGFQESCGMTDQDANCTPNGYTHLADRRFETRDSQILLGKLVDAGIADPKELASTGGSYGGGQTWLLATSLPWQSPKGATLQLAAAVPKYPWTDLLDSLTPNGRATPAVDQSASHTVPFGIAKESYVVRPVRRRPGQGERPVRREPARLRDEPRRADSSAIQQGEPYDPSTDPRLAADRRLLHLPLAVRRDRLLRRAAVEARSARCRCCRSRAGPIRSSRQCRRCRCSAS